jgi:hypothetical protein
MRLTECILVVALTCCVHCFVFSTSARHVKACVEVERQHRKLFRKGATKYEKIVENIYREFRTCESHRVRGVRDGLWYCLTTGIQQCLDRMTNRILDNGKVLLSIDPMIDFKVYDEFNARIRKWKDGNQHNAETSRETDTNRDTETNRDTPTSSGSPPRDTMVRHVYGVLAGGRDSF